MSEISGIAAVVLNYKSWQDTVNSVGDLLAQDYPDKHIVIVENGSGNDSAERLYSLFGSEPKVTILVSEKNLGFAKGNNMGVRYAHEMLGYDTVFVVNSDTRIPKGLFKAIAGVDPNGLGTVSPLVVGADGQVQCFPVNCKNIRSHAFGTVWNLFKANVVSWPLINGIYKRVKQRQKALHGAGDEGDASVERYVLQGCAYFLMPDFFRHYRGIYPRTFLYWEEVDLLLMLKRAGLASVYVETPPVTHFGGGSTDVYNKKASLFRLKQSNRSMVKSLPLIVGMSEKHIKRCIDKSEQFNSGLTR